MDKCLLFTKHLDENGCFCLKLSQDGELLAPPAQRNFAEIKTLQQECGTIVIETSASASIFDLELPWIPERKARVAIPYALEDKLAQSIEELHFAFDKLRYQNNHYLITVIDKKRIKAIIQLLDEQEIEFDAITLDWFALAPQELIVSDSLLLINNDDYKGSLSGDIALTYLKKHPMSETLLFEDSQLVTDSSIIKHKEFSHTWIARKIINSKPLNLCQGDLEHGKNSDWMKKGYQLAAVLCCFWLISIVLANAISLYFLNKQTNTIDKQIADIYHEYFPAAKQVISPKFRINQLIGSNSGDSQARFWFLLNQFSKAMKTKTITLEELRFQNKILSVTLVCSDFAKLEAIENKLKDLQLKVKQTQASTRDQHVVATLELM